MKRDEFEFYVEKVKGKFRAFHIPTKLEYTDESKEVACFELGKLVERQMQFKFDEQFSGCTK